jgi:hypothetical protein
MAAAQALAFLCQAAFKQIRQLQRRRERAQLVMDT